MWVSVTSDPLLLIPSSVLANAVVKLAWSWAAVRAAGAGKNYGNTCALMDGVGAECMHESDMANPCPPFICESFSGLLDWPFQTPRP